jgi:DNA-binding NarL/FixJ family response regulator
MIRVGLIDDNFSLLKTYREFLNDFGIIRVVFAYSSLQELDTQPLQQLDPDVVLLDIGMPEPADLAGISYLRKKFPAARIVMLNSVEERETILEALRLGVAGCISKSGRLLDIYEGILGVYREGGYLSPGTAQLLISEFQKSPEQGFKGILTDRESELVELLKDGLSYRDIAERMYITVHTVNHHLRKIYEKLNVNSRSELLARLYRHKN